MAAATSTFISYTSGLTFPSHLWGGHRQGGNHAEAPQGRTSRKSWTHGSRLGGGVEADPGQVGQPGDPLGTTTAGRARSMIGRPRAATTGTPFMTTLPQGTWAP